MLNQKYNIQLSQQLADRTNKPVAIWTNSRGQVNIQFAANDPIKPFGTLHSVVDPKEVLEL